MERRRRCCGSGQQGVDADTHAAILTGHAKISSVRARPARGPHARGGPAGPPRRPGLPLHLGSQLADPTPYRAAIGVLAGLGEQPVYSLGGGYAVAYTPDDRPPGIDASVGAVVEAAHDLLGPASGW